jgi:hypothetical protein
MAVGVMTVEMDAVFDVLGETSEGRRDGGHVEARSRTGGFGSRMRVVFGCQMGRKSRRGGEAVAEVLRLSARDCWGGVVAQAGEVRYSHRG